MPKLLYYTATSLSVLVAATMAARAADMPLKTKAPPLPPAPLPSSFTWTGFYIGANIGGAWPHETVTDSMFRMNFGNGNGNGSFIGGGEAGFNYQIGKFVVGVEGDIDGVSGNNKMGTAVFIPALGQTFRVDSNDRWIATAAARLGVTVTDRLLLYGKAGGGWVGDSGFMVTDVTTGLTTTTLKNNNDTGGWVVGAGLEWAFANNLTAKVEYDYLGLHGQSVTIPATSAVLPGDTFNTGTHNVQMLKVGLNYLFNWGMKY